MKKNLNEKLIIVAFAALGLAFTGCGGTSGTGFTSLIPSAQSGTFLGGGNPGGFYPQSCSNNVCKQTIPISGRLTYYHKTSSSYQSGSYYGLFPVSSQPADLGPIYANDHVVVSASGGWTYTPHYTTFSNSCPYDHNLIGDNTSSSSGAILSPDNTNGFELFTASDVFMDGKTTGLSTAVYASSNGELYMGIDGGSAGEGCLDISLSGHIDRCTDGSGNSIKCP